MDTFEHTQEKKRRLDAMYEKYKACIACPLGSLGRTTVVFGEGNVDATIMFIGEGPGREEDEQGRPFVGRSGKLLNRMLQIAGIEREQVYITNIVKCRPPNNRQPTNLESLTCKKLLLVNQLNIIQPQVICTLGASALQGLLEQKVAISSLRGKPFAWQNNITVIPTFHPAYILRNPTQLEKMVDDLCKVQQLAPKNYK